MGACHGKSALGEGDVPAAKKPHKHNRNKHNGNSALKKSCIHTYPVDVPILVYKKPEKTKGNGHTMRCEQNSRSRSSIDNHNTNGQNGGVLEPCEPDFPSYGPNCTTPESCDPDTPQPRDLESCDPSSQASCDIDSPVSCDQQRIPASDSGIYSVSQSSSHEATPTTLCGTTTEGEVTLGEDSVEKTPLNSPAKKDPSACRCESRSMGSLENIGDVLKVVPPSNLPVKRFLGNPGLPPPRPQSETCFSFKRLRKRKAVSGIEKSSVNRRSWKSQDSFDITSAMRTGMSHAGSECSDMCICDELYNIHAPLAQFDSILTMDSPSCGSLHGLPEGDGVEIDGSDVAESACQSGSMRNILFTCSICKKSMSSQMSVIEHPCLRPCGHRQRNSLLSSGRNSRCEGSEKELAMLDLSDELIPVSIDGHEMVIIDAQTYNQLISDLSLVRFKLERIYNLLLQEEFDSISDIINNSGLESCLLET